MTSRMNNKGQTALETSFVILLVVVAISHVVTNANLLNYKAITMAKARAEAQGAAFELSMKGVTTHLVRIDENTTQPGFKVDLYVMSKDCSQARANFAARINAIRQNMVGKWKCNNSLYSNTLFQ